MPLYLKDKMVSGISLGVPGKSAYEQAKEGGYTGTEEEFAQILANAATKDYVDEAIGEIPTPDVSGQIDTHNTDSSAHADIRTALNGKAPAGYGLGSNIGLGVPDCNTAIKSGWYYTGGGTSNGPIVNGVEQLYLSMLVSAREEFVDQIVFGHYQGNHRIWRRYSVDTGATWTEWECLIHTYGTTDLTAGSSPLATGQLHFVYE